MAKFNTIRNSFISGEISPKYFGRQDVQQYFSACEEVRNFIINAQGGASRRPGTQYVDFEAIDASYAPLASASHIRLIPYVYSRTLSYMLANGDTGANNVFAIHPSLTMSGISTGVVTGAIGRSPIDEISYAQSGLYLVVVGGSAGLAGPTIISYNALDEAFNAEHTNTRASVPTVSVDPINVPAQVLIRRTSVTNRFPYFQNQDATFTLTPSAVSGNITLTSSKPYFNALMVGSAAYASTIFKLNGGYALVTGFTNSTSVSATVVGSNLSGTGADAAFYESAWSSYRGYPRKVAFFENRVLYFGNDSFPDVVWGSKVGDISYMDGTAATVPTDAFGIQLTSERPDDISWVSVGKKIFLGTFSSEHVLEKFDSTKSYGATNVFSESHSGIGSHILCRAVKHENDIVFAERGGKKLRQMVFDFNEDSYKTYDMMAFAEHLTFRGKENRSSFVDQIIIDAHPVTTGSTGIWFIDNNFWLYRLTKDKANGVLAYSHHPLGGNYNDEAPRVESIAVCPSSNGGHDDLWLVVSRTLESGTVRSIERINAEFSNLVLSDASISFLDKPFYSDMCKFVQLGAPATSFTGFDYLEGDTVDVVADGIYVGQKVVTGGTITLDDAATEVVAGLPYRSLIKPTPVEAGSQLESSVGRVKRVHRAAVRFFKSVGCKVGPNENDLSSVEFRAASDIAGDPIPLFSGVKNVDIDGDYEDTVLQPVIVQDLPLPCTVVSVTYEGQEYD